MSGAETIAILGVISSIISIVDGTKQVYDAAKNAQGLPAAFRDVASRLPIVRDILESARQNINSGKIDEGSCKGIKDVVNACETKAKRLDELFHKANPTNSTSDLRRYYKAVKAHGRGNEVENLMQGILEDAQLLACDHGMKVATKFQEQRIAQAIVDMSNIQPSVPEDVFQETGLTANNTGSGTQFNTQGDFAQGTARQYNSAGGNMNFEPSQLNAHEQRVSMSYNAHTQHITFSGSSQVNARACLAALFLTDPIDDREKLITTKGSRADGTCEWIIENMHYRSWLESRSQLLWLSGGPGKGKTMLSIYLAEHLESTLKDVPLLQYFCDNKDERRNTAVTVLRGLLFQLFRLRPELMTYILPIFEIRKESLFEHSSFETLWKIFEKILRDLSLGPVYCILDGLDECDSVSLKALLRRIRALFPTKVGETPSSRLHLLIVSRDLPNFIPEVLLGFPRVHLDIDSDSDARISRDIDRFIETKTNELATCKNYSPELRAFVQDTLQSKAQGTFLWVSLVVAALEDCNAIEVEDTLDLFPAGLDGVYARMLLQIHPNRRILAAKLLRWVVMAVRPLKLSELGVVLADNNRQTVHHLDRNETTKMQLSYCGYFVTIKKDEVGLIHQSAKDYLLRTATDMDPVLEAFRVKVAEAHADIAITCFDYLNDVALSQQLDGRNPFTRIKAFPLLPYAAFYWPEHAKSLNRTERIFDLSLPFYQKDSQVRESWLWMYWKEMGTFWPLDLGDMEQRVSFPLLHIACLLGLLPLVENLLSSSGLFNQVKLFFNLRQRNGSGSTALHLAAGQGNTAVVQLLLDKGANITAKKSGMGMADWTALEEAAITGHVDAVQLLLDRKDGFDERRTAIFDAALYGQTGVITSVLNRGGNIIKDHGLVSTLGIAMLKAAHLWQESVVRLLLNMGAQVDYVDEDLGPALTIAAVEGDTATVKLLLENGANPNFKTNKNLAYKVGPLHAAATCKDKNLARTLLEHGADIEARYNEACPRLPYNKAFPRNSTPLLSAAKWRNVNVLALLLEKGANANAVDADGNTALHLAAGGYRDGRRIPNCIDQDSTWACRITVRLLIGIGVNTKIKNANGELALDVAEYQEVRELLRAVQSD